MSTSRKRLLANNFSRLGYRDALYALLRDGNTIADYDMSRGVTGTIYASEVANQIPLSNQPHGDAGSLLQATGSAQPWHLPFVGAKYAWNGNVAGNTLTSPNKSVTGNQTFTFDVASNDYTPAADITIATKTSGNDGFVIKLLTTGVIRLTVGDGAGLTNVDSTAATGLTDGTRHTIGIIWTDGVGASFTVDGAALGTAVAAVKTLTNASIALTLGVWSGKIYRAQVGSVYDFNAEDWPDTSTNGATATSSTTGEVWTLNNTGTLKAQIVGDASLLFDGTAQFMKAAAFTSAQPTVVFLDGKQPTWTITRAVYDGNTLATGELIKTTTTPQVNINAGSSVAANTDWALNTHKIVVATFNGASSSLQVGGAAATTGNAGVGNMAGFTLGANGGNLLFGNTQVSRVIIRNSAVNADAIRTLMMALSGTT